MLNKPGLKRTALSTATLAALAATPVTQANSLSPETQQTATAPYETKSGCTLNFDSGEALFANLDDSSECYDSLGYGDGYGDGGDQSCIIPNDNDQTLKPSIQPLPECGLAGLEQAQKLYRRS
ncbi:hypothetical protein [Motiliproteus sp. MSK22-1]|uniref:hypothetical protein n=1 Tax=Motiliproteus sp. MSK22-1 TaxID=1897630 RepID=UPI0009768C1C|nr:hypothetical protein [Motiliproteus sp. MSK22-1]OMH38967.1 hypothetical protein BGP75_04370 [Motiliproteus sp. MSK22-1]